MREKISLFLKGMGMGAANVIPGVSGGTIALITGIFERLVHSIKSFDLKAIRLILQGKVSDFLAYTDFYFLVIVVAGALVSVVSLAKILGFLFDFYPVYIWSYFFGLILASVFFVGKTVDRFSFSVLLLFLTGGVVAMGLSFLSPASGNSHFFYLFLCGVAAICSMILPGLSGSFILILMGNYELVMIDAVNNVDLLILFPVVLGAGIGLLFFSRLLSWVYSHYKNETISILTGFIFGSLLILWPWKTVLYRLDESGEMILRSGEPVIQKYEPFFPETFSSEVAIAFGFMILGVLTIWGTEKLASVLSHR